MKLEREKILSRAFDGEERKVLVRTLDKAEIVLNNGLIQVTDFFDPYRTGLVISAVQRLGLTAAADGGYQGAERKRVAICPAGVSPLPEDYNFGFISIKGNFKMSKVTHRDIQGALMGLGLKRDKFGDIIVGQDYAGVVLAGEVLPYILGTLRRVGNVSVEVSAHGPGDFQSNPVKYREIKATVPSLRLDAVAAAGFGISRSRAVREIKAERLSVNWHICKAPDVPVKEGDVLSARGRGRVNVAVVKGPLKSGRILVILHRLV